MKLEVGKCYTNFNKEKNKIVLQKNNGDWVVYNCKRDTVLIYDQNRVYCYLISEWVEPVEHEVEVAFWKKEGAIRASQDLCYWGAPIAKVKVNFTEGDGL